MKTVKTTYCIVDESSKKGELRQRLQRDFPLPEHNDLPKRTKKQPETSPRGK